MEEYEQQHNEDMQAEAEYFASKEAEVMNDIENERILDRTFDNSMLVWYPKIKDIVPTPKTEYVELPNQAGLEWADWIDRDVPEEYIVKIKEAINRVTNGRLPVFIRTDQLADKHGWIDTCFVDDLNKINQNIRNLIETNVMVDMIGDMQPRAIFVREFLKLKSHFTAYKGMPVAREFRFFATNGKIDCWHPYWPKDAIAQGNPSNKEWERWLPEMEKLTEEEFAHLTELASKASAQFDEQVSIDICQAEDGRWYVTDMAQGERSFHIEHDK